VPEKPARPLQVLFALLLLGGVLPDAGSAVPPPSGDWVITGDETIDGENVTLNGSIFVEDGASLTVQGTNLSIPYPFYIEIKSGGRLNVSSSFINSNVAYYWDPRVRIYGNATLSGSCFSKMQLGLYARSGCDIDGCRFNDSGTPIYATDTNLMVTDCIFVGIEYGCINLNGGSSRIQGCRFFHTEKDTVYWPGSSGQWSASDGVCYFNNLFINNSYAVRVWSGQGQGMDSAVLYSYWGQSTNSLAVLECCIAGFSSGTVVSGQMSYVHLWFNDNTIENSYTAMDLSYYSSYGTDVKRNRISNGRIGIRMYTGDVYVEDNIISNMSSYGIMTEYYSQFSSHSRISGNVLSNCWFGAYLYDFEGAITDNTFLDCHGMGLYLDLRYRGYKGTEVRENLFQRCSLLANGENAALTLYCDMGARVQVRENTLIDNPAIGIFAWGGMEIRNNSISGSETGVLLARADQYASIMGNSISRGTAGLDLGAQAYVISNNISVNGTGVQLSIDARSDGDSLIQDNTINATRLGISVLDRNESMRSTDIIYNWISSRGEGVLAESSWVNVIGNDFTGTKGYCVHSRGRAPVLEENGFLGGPVGILHQEWYLNLTAQERSPPDGTGPYVPSTGTDVSIRDRLGNLAISSRTSNSGHLRTNLTGYTLDAWAHRNDLAPYNITMLKPRTGIGLATIELQNNTAALLSLQSTFDLAIGQLEIPVRRPPQQQLVPVNLSIINDATYAVVPRSFYGVKVNLTDNGQLVGERLISTVFPGEWSNVTFLWSTTPGNHTLRAMVDPDDTIDELFKDNNAVQLDVAINGPPMAVLEVDRLSVTLGDAISFMANESCDDSAVTAYLYDFGDGTPSVWTREPWAEHIYARPGSYDAKLMVMDSDGATSEWSPTITITVLGRDFQVVLSTDASQVDTLGTVTLSATARDPCGDIRDYLWDFGDGTTQYDRNASRVEHVYQHSGTYTISVRMSDTTDCNGTASATITVRNRAPSAGFGFSPPDRSHTRVVHLHGQGPGRDRLPKALGFRGRHPELRARADPSLHGERQLHGHTGGARRFRRLERTLREEHQHPEPPAGRQGLRVAADRPCRRERRARRLPHGGPGRFPERPEVLLEHRRRLEVRGSPSLPQVRFPREIHGPLNGVRRRRRRRFHGNDH